jgi:hypothetical protein
MIRAGGPIDMAKININAGIYTAEVHALVKAGKLFALVVSRGDNKGNIVSTHKRRDLAERASRGYDYSVVDLTSLTDIGLVD